MKQLFHIIILAMLFSSLACKKRIVFSDSLSQRETALQVATEFFSEINSYQLPSSVKLPFYLHRNIYVEPGSLNTKLTSLFSTKYPRTWKVKADSALTADEIIAIKHHDLTDIKVKSLIDFDYAVTIRILDNEETRRVTLLLKLFPDNQWKINGLGPWFN